MDWNNLEQRFIENKKVVDVISTSLPESIDAIKERFKGYMKNSINKASILKIDNPDGIKELVFKDGYCQVIGVHIPQPFYVVPDGMTFPKEIYTMDVDLFFATSLICLKFSGKVIFNPEKKNAIPIGLNAKGEMEFKRSSMCNDKSEKQESWDFKPEEEKPSVELSPLVLSDFIKLIATSEYEHIHSLRSVTGDVIGTMCKSKYIDGYIFFKQSFKSTHRWEGQLFFNHGWSIDKQMFSEQILNKCKLIHIFDTIEEKDKSLLKIHYFTTPEHYIQKGGEHNYSDRGTQVCLPVVNKFKNIQEGDNWVVFVEFNVDQAKPWWRYYSERGIKHNGK